MNTSFYGAHRKAGPSHTLQIPQITYSYKQHTTYTLLPSATLHHVSRRVIAITQHLRTCCLKRVPLLPSDEHQQGQWLCSIWDFVISLAFVIRSSYRMRSNCSQFSRFMSSSANIWQQERKWAVFARLPIAIDGRYSEVAKRSTDMVKSPTIRCHCVTASL